MAQALDEKLSSEEAVKHYKESLNQVQVSDIKSKEPIKSTKKANDSKKLTSKSSEKLNSQRNDARSTTKQDKEKVNDVKTKRKENASVKADNQSKKTQQYKTVIKKNVKEHKDQLNEDITQTRNKSLASNILEKEKVHNILNKAQSQESNTSVDKEDHIDSNLTVDTVVTSRLEQSDEGKLNSSYTIAENDLNSSLSSNDLIESANINLDKIKPQESNMNKEISLINIDHQNETNNECNDNVNLNSLELDVNTKEKLKTHATLVKNEPEITTTEKHDATNVVKLPLAVGSDSKLIRPPSVRPSSSRPGAPRMREKLDNVIKDTDNLLLGKVNIIIEYTQNEEVGT